VSFFQNHSGWPLVPLKNIATLKRGYDLPVGSRNEGAVPIYAANGKNGAHDEVKIKGPGVITGRSGTIGKVHYCEEGFWPLNTALYVMDFHGNHPRWVYYMLSAFKLERFSEGAGVPTLNRNLVHDELIPLPPLSEQKRIAAILDKADAIRRKRQQAIQLADDFLRAVFLDMFGDPVTNPKGWPVDKFGNVFDVRDGTHDSPSYVSSGFPLVTSKNIKNGEIDMSDVNYISKEDYELINRRSKVDVGDILMPMIGTIGNPAIVRDEPLFAIKNVALIKLGRSSPPAGFVLALLNGPLLETAVQQKSRGGTQKFLGLGDIRDLNCYLPDERLVSKYIGIANKVRQFASAYRRAVEADLEASLSQKAFSGQL